MKRFITISLLAALWLPTMACLWIQTNNSYLFSPLDKQEFRRRVEMNPPRPEEREETSEE